MYYVYKLKYPESNITFYVGKGKGRRAAYHTMRNKKGYWTDNRYKDNVIRQILNTGVDPLIEYVFYTEDENIAYDHEEALIKKYGRRLFDENGILTNICDSGRPPHLEYSKERKDKYRERMIGNTLNTGRKQSEEEKLQRGNTLLESYRTGKRQITDRMRESSRITHTGKIVSEKTRKKQSESARCRAARPGTAIIINGIEYASIAQASKILGVSGFFCKKMADNYIHVEKKSQIKGSNNPGAITRAARGCNSPNKKSVTIDGIVYESIKAASKILCISELMIKRQSDEYSKKI